MVSPDRLLAFVVTATIVIVIPGPSVLFVVGRALSAGRRVWAFAAGGVRLWFTRSPRRLELIGGAGGLAIVAVGAGLLATGRKS